ncbi:MAG: type I polyketide synthase [bacterium]|nr:type I polyketide synthase [bacterium]
MSEKKQSPVKQALFAIKELKAKLEIAERSKGEAIAIVGMSCRIPGGASSAEEFWKLLVSGTDAVGEIPADRWNVDELWGEQNEAGKIYGRWGAFLDEVDQFDPEFFGISPVEARGMDPQQRLLCKVSWEALEEAGIPPRDLKNTSTGVFVGVMNLDYYSLLVREKSLESFDAYTGTGAIFSATSGRISYVLGLQGPSVAVDNACASSLVSTSLAVQSLRNGDCDIALAGGVNLFLTPETYLIRTAANMLSPTGRCHTFDASADGYVPGEGCGVLVLKRLSDAIKNEDNIIATIRGVAINHDGPSSGLTVPNGVSQQKVIRHALENAQVQAEDIGYIEAHGTGTPLGDPIEVNALQSLMAGKRTAPLYVASLKTNVGHMESAAGIGGLMKVALSLQHKQIPPHLHLNEVNSKIDFDAIPARVPKVVEDWPEINGTRLAGVSSFSLTGTNSHIVLEQAPDVPRPPDVAAPADDAKQNRLFVLSAQTDAALKEYAERYGDYMNRKKDSVSMTDLAYTLGRRRSHLEHRLAIAAETPEQLCESLEAFARGEMNPRATTAIEVPGMQRKVAFVFSGQGSQWAGMGQALYKSEQTFREMLDRISGIFEKLSGWSLRDELVNNNGARLDETEVAQPAIFALQAGLIAVLAEYGIKPQAVVGHSIGEAAAAYAAGVLSLEDAVFVVYHRSRLMQQGTGLGKMAAIGISLEELEGYIKGKEDVVAVGAHNSPGSVVVSGDESTIGEILGALPEGTFQRMLPVNYAFHSPQMEPFSQELVSTLSGLATSEPAIPIFPTVSEADPARSYDAAYWGRNVREAVSFAPAIQKMAAAGYNVFIEIGPHSVLATPIKQILDDGEQSGIILPTLRRDQNDHAMLVGAIGNAFIQGLPVKTKDIWPGGRLLTNLPAYPWQLKRYWLEVQSSGGSARMLPPGAHPLLGMKIESPVPGDAVIYQSTVSSRDLPFLKDHVILGQVIFPGAGFLEMALSAATEFYGTDQLDVNRLSILQPLTLENDDVSKTVQIRMEAQDGRLNFNIYSRAASSAWKEHSSGQIEMRKADATPNADVAAAGADFAAKDFYNKVGAAGFHYGAAFQGIHKLQVESDSAIAHLAPTDAVLKSGSQYSFNPALLDSAIHIALAPLYCVGEAATGPGVFLPVGFDRFSFFARPDIGDGAEELWSRVRFREPLTAKSKSLHCDIEILQGKNRIAYFSNFLIKHANLTSLSSRDEWMYDLSWKKQPALKGNGSRKGVWLILTDENETGSDLAAALGSSVRIIPESGVSNEAEGIFAVDSLDRAALEKIIEQNFTGDQTACAGIVFARGLSGDTKSLLADITAEACANQMRDLYGAFLTLTQACTGVDWSGDQPPLYLLTRGAQSVHETTGASAPVEAVNPFQAGLWGQARVIAVEHSEFFSTMVDLDPGMDLAQQIKGIAAPLSSENTNDHIAIRKGEWYSAALEPIRAGATDEKTALAIDESGSYLVTGGLSGLGLRVAWWLVEQGARHLVLVGRRSPTEETLKILGELEQKGAQIQTVQGDVSRSEDVERMIQSVSKDHPIKGVIHSAGVIKDRLIAQMSWDDFEAVLVPKISGSLNLHQFTGDLDFFVTFSSLTSIVGTGGQSNYAAANAFMDGLSYFRRSQGAAALSINWAALAETGMATGISDDLWQQIGMTPMPPSDAMVLMGQLIASGRPEASVVAVNWAKYLDQFTSGYRPGVIAHLAPASVSAAAAPETSGAFADLLEKTEPRKRLEATAKHIEAHVVSILGFDKDKVLEHQKGLSDIGLDSLNAVELKNRLQRSLGKSLPATIAFDYPTIKTMSNYVTVELLKLEVKSGAAAKKSAGAKPQPEPKRKPARVQAVAAAASGPANAGDEDILADLENLSDDAIESMLREKLDQL